MDNSFNRHKNTKILLNSVIANVTSEYVAFPSVKRTLEAIVIGTGAVGATVKVYGCNTPRNTNGILLATITLSGTTSDQGGSELTVEWPYMYAVLSGISGTGAAVTCSVAV